MATCVICAQPIADPDADAVYLDDSFRRRNQLPANRPHALRHAERAHLACIGDPSGLDRESVVQWCVHRVHLIQTTIAENHAATQREFEIMHRALHALPPELTQAYQDELYGDDDPS